MPIYEYKCEACDNRYELLCSMNQDSSEVCCPKCQEKRSRKIMSTFAARSGGSSDSSGVSMPRGIGGMSKCGSCASTSCATCH